MLKKLFLFMAAISAVILIIILTDSLCLSKAVIGFPCPGCGMTRANLHFIKGEFSSAFSLHPLFLAVDVYILFVAYYIFMLNLRESKTVKISAMIFAVLLFLVYIYRMIILYPDIEPMVYNYNSLFYRLFHL